jgi:hypothetical protein
MAVLAKSDLSEMRLTRTKNPILWQELTHQERTSPRWMRLGKYFSIAAVIAIVAFILATLTAPDGYPTTLIALYSIWIIHAATAVRAIAAGANAISREHVGLTWDALALTGVSARRIFFGKWRAALFHVRGWMVVLGLIRLATLPIFPLALVKTFAWYACGRYTYYCDNEIEFSLVTWAVPLAVVMTVVLTLLEVLCCTALGLAASALTRRGTTAAISAILIRFTPVILFAGMTRYEVGGFSWRWWRYMPFTIADGGTTPLMRLVLPLMPWTTDQHVAALPGLFLSTLLLLLLLWASLAAGLLIVRHTGALPHLRNNSRQAELQGT